MRRFPSIVPIDSFAILYEKVPALFDVGVVSVYVGIPVAALLVIFGKPESVGFTRQLRRIFVILAPAIVPAAFISVHTRVSGCENIETR